MTEALLRLVVEFDVKGRAVHDANLVATMHVAGLRRLLTHNVQDVARYERAGLIEVVSLVPA